MNIFERNKMVTQNLGLVLKIADECHREGMDIRDLVQEGVKGLIQAVEKYDSSKGKFSSHAYWNIKGYIFRYLTDTFSIIKIGTTTEQRKLFWKYDPERDADNEAYREIAALSHVDSLDEVLPYSNGEDMTLGNRIMSQEQDALDKLLQEEKRGQVFAFREKLSGRDRQIWNMRFCQDEPKDHKAVGVYLGLSGWYVTRIERRLIDRFRRYITEYGLETPNVVDPKFIAWSAHCTKCDERSYLGSLEGRNGEMIGVICHKCGNTQYLGKEARYPIKITIREEI
jgi:RNA polymerase sigma-32 factor